MTQYIRKLRAGRVANASANTWVGENGTIFYNETTGQLRIADGVTPGGHYVNLVVATSTVLGGIKAGPGANVSADGTLTINTAGLPLSFGDFSANVNILSTVNANEDMILASNGTGNVDLVGNVGFFTTATGPTGTPLFSVNNQGNVVVNGKLIVNGQSYFIGNETNFGNIVVNGVTTFNGAISITGNSVQTGLSTFIVSTVNTTQGAVEITGDSAAGYQAPINTGVMLQVTGQINQPSRIYNDAQNNFPTYAGRRYNGNVTAPTQVLNNQDVVRLGGTGYTSGGWFGNGIARISLVANEDQTLTNQGSRIELWVTPNGSNSSSITNAVTVTANLMTVNGNVSAGYINSGNFSSAGNISVSAGSAQWTFDSNGVLTVPGNVVPQSTGAYTLGDATHKWADVWIGPNTLNIEDTVTGNNAALSVTNGVLQINGLNQLQVGQLKFVDNSIESTTGNIDIQIGSTDSTANLVLNCNVVLATGKTLTTGNVAVGGTFTPAKGITHNATKPTIVANVVLINFDTDDLILVHTTGPGTTITANLVNLSTTVGKTVEVLVMSSAGGSTQFNHGVASSQSTNANSFFVTSHQTMYVKYFNIDGTTGNLFVTAIGNNTI